MLKKQLKKQLSIFLATLIILPTLSLSSFANETEIKYTFGGSGNEVIRDYVKTNDGDIVICGYSQSTDFDMEGNKGGTDAIVVKYDTNGNLLWKQSFGGSNYDNFSNMSILENGDIIAYGYSQSNDFDMEGLGKGGIDAIIVKYDTNGNLLWKKSFGGSGADSFSNMSILENGDIIAYGYSFSTDFDMEGLGKGNSDAIFVKYDANGNLLWKKSFGGSNTDTLNKSLTLENGDIIAYGSSYSKDFDMEGLGKGNTDAIVVKYSANGNLLWKKSFGGSNDESFNNISILDNGDIVAYGTSISTDFDMEGLNKGGQDAIIVKYDTNGNLLWKKSFGGSGFDLFTNISILENGDIVAYGTFSSTDFDMEGLNKGGQDAIIVKYDTNGNLLWKQSFGGSGSDSFSNMSILENGDMIFYGSSSSTDFDMAEMGKGASDVIIVKYDTNGNLLWKQSFGGSNYDNFSNMSILENGDITFYGSSSSTDFDMAGTPIGTKNIFVSLNNNGDFKLVKSVIRKGVIEKLMSVELSDSYIFIGNTSDINTFPTSKGGTDIFFMKTDLNGNVLKVANDLLIEVRALVDNLEANPSLENVSVALDKWSLLNEDDNKVSLFNRIFNVFEVIANNTIDTATSIEMLEELENFINSNEALKTASSEILINIELAKLNIENQSEVVKLQEATAAVVKAEKSKSQTDLNTARTLVNALTDSEAKTALVSRLDAVQDIIDNPVIPVIPTDLSVKQAERLVSLAEILKRDSHVNTAQAAIDKIENSEDKAKLQTRLDKVKAEIEELNKPPVQDVNTEKALKDAQRLVDSAKLFKRTEYIVNALTAVNKLNDSPEKTAMLAELDALKEAPALNKALETAIKAVEQAEVSKASFAIRLAEKYVNALPDGVDKEALLERISNIK